MLSGTIEAESTRTAESTMLLLSARTCDPCTANNLLYPTANVRPTSAIALRAPTTEAAGSDGRSGTSREVIRRDVPVTVARPDRSKRAL